MRSSMLQWAPSADCPIMISNTWKCIRINHRRRDGWGKGREKNMDGNKFFSEWLVEGGRNTGQDPTDVNSVISCVKHVSGAHVQPNF